MTSKETAVQYMIRQLRYAYDAKKAGTVNGELDVDDVEYFGEIALKMESKQILDAFEAGVNDNEDDLIPNRSVLYYIKTFGSQGNSDINNKTNNMAQQTAMEQLIEWIDWDCTPMDCVMKAKELLKVEKEQILNARLDGFKGSAEGWNGEYPGWDDKETPIKINNEQYYNETYNTQNK